MSGSKGADSTGDPALDAALAQLKGALKARRAETTLAFHPITTIVTFLKVAAGYVRRGIRAVLEQEVLCYAILLVSVALSGLYITPGSHQVVSSAPLPLPMCQLLRSHLHVEISFCCL